MPPSPENALACAKEERCFEDVVGNDGKTKTTSEEEGLSPIHTPSGAQSTGLLAIFS